jgi:hypothetical protein
MTYTTGSLILRDDYNIFATGAAAGTANHAVNNINTLWGTGVGDKGYGQTTVLSAVDAGNTVTATQWATMIARMTSLASQQASTITAITQPTVGNTISVFAALSGNLSTLTTNRLNKAANGTDIVTGGTATTATGWTTTRTATHTITFASADAARYFFNAGGEIRIACTRTGGTSTTKNTNWSQLLTDCGTTVFASQGTTKSGGAGSPTTVATTIGYYDMTTTDQTVFKQFAVGAPYTVNALTVSAKTNGVQGANGDVGTVVTITVLFDDAEVDTVNDTVDGTLTSTCTVRPPSTTYLTNTWGTPTISSSIV